MIALLLSLLLCHLSSQVGLTEAKRHLLNVRYFVSRSIEESSTCPPPTPSYPPVITPERSISPKGKGP
ncbi:hypothetical protein AALP_AA8G084200 [Arabis alpina]|uniref:Secreted protein n=1 Tax=Arabis alpina TaxID=50452 RepID=A0A087G5S7_ARAAL|nr:hypothetical protein AALP_AA8G084200 [Arabis alpina]